MITLEDLVLKLSITGENTTAAGIKKTEAAVESVGETAKEAGESFSVAKGGIIGFVTELTTAVTAITGFVAAVAALAGVNQAGKFERMEGNLASIIGDARKARDLFRDIKDMGEHSGFDTGGIDNFAKDLVSTGTAASEASRQLKILTTFGKATFQSQEGMQGIMSDLAQMRLKPHLDTSDAAGLQGKGFPLLKTLEAATGQKFTSQLQAQFYLAGMSGQRAYETLLKGMDKEFGHAYASGGGFLGMLHDLSQTFSDVMEPTGRLVISVLEPIGELVRTVGGWAGRLNELMQGWLGVLAVTGLLVKAKGALVLTYRATIGAAMQLTAAMEGLAASMVTASATAGVQSAANGGAAAASAANAAGAGGAALAARGLAGGALTGVMADLAAVALPVTIAVIASQAIGSLVGGQLGTFLKAAGSGAAIGAGIGSVIPGLGTAVGGIVGGIIGGVGSIFSMMFHDDKRPVTGNDDAAARTADNTERTASALEDIRGQLIGGGSRARRVQGDLELELAIARMLSI